MLGLNETLSVSVLHPHTSHNTRYLSRHAQLSMFVFVFGDVTQELRATESSDRFSVQINAYLDNIIDVRALLEDSEMKAAALEHADELQHELSLVSTITSTHVALLLFTSRGDDVVLLF